MMAPYDFSIEAVLSQVIPLIAYLATSKLYASDLGNIL